MYYQDIWHDLLGFRYYDFSCMHELVLPMGYARDDLIISVYTLLTFFSTLEILLTSFGFSQHTSSVGCETQSRSSMRLLAVREGLLASLALGLSWF